MTNNNNINNNTLVATLDKATETAINLNEALKLDLMLLEAYEKLENKEEGWYLW